MKGANKGKEVGRGKSPEAPVLAKPGNPGDLEGTRAPGFANAVESAEKLPKIRSGALAREDQDYGELVPRRADQPSLVGLLHAPPVGRRRERRELL